MGEEVEDSAIKVVNSGENENSSTVSASAPEQENAYGSIPAMPCIEAVEGIRYDFNQGLRVFFPDNGKKYKLIFKDADAGLLLYNASTQPGTIVSSVKKYYIRYQFEVWDEKEETKLFEHTLDLANKEVCVQMPVNTIGDSVGWFSYLERFQKKHNCKLVVCVSQFMIDLFAKQYPNFRFILKEETASVVPYATYCLGLFFQGNKENQPIDFRLVGLHRTAGYILGLRTREELEDIPPRLDLSAKRTIKEKYVCIATKASAQCKLWNNPFGWDGVIRFLLNNGYRVLCIDKSPIIGKDDLYNTLPWGVEDFTGEHPLQERVNLIKDADFFIGLSSGLTWLAWCCKVPVVLISGFTLPSCEFYTPYRIIRYDDCIGCWDDVRENFDHNDFFWCPRKKERSEKYACSRIITAEQVINTIKTIPTFKEGSKNNEAKGRPRK